MPIQEISFMHMYNLLLANFHKHVSLDEDEQHALINRLKSKTYKRKAKVLYAGDTCKAVSFVVKGCLRMYYTDDDGYEHIVNFFAENWWATDGPDSAKSGNQQQKGNEGELTFKKQDT